MGRKSKLYWILMIIICAGIVLGVGNFVKGYFTREEKEIAKFSEGYMNDILKQSVWDIKSHVDNKIETIEITRRINERNHFDIEELPEWIRESYDFEGAYADLKEEDTEFLREHVFGQWRFTERLSTSGRQEEYNFSEQGIEDMKNIVVYFDADRINIVSGLNQDTFADAQDAYAFSDYGGFFSTELSVYRVRKDINTRSVSLHNDFATVNMSEKEELVLVDCTLGYLEDSTYRPMLEGDNGFPCGYLRYLYVDPEDTDTMYMCFCGMWELKRDNKDYQDESETRLLLGRSDEKWEYDLTEEDEEFLEKHLFGQWEFSDRLIALDEDRNRHIGTISNFSSLGIEELKKVRFTYDVRTVRALFLRKFLTDPRDMYLFGIYGGLNAVDLPYYHIDTEVDEDNICLMDIYGAGTYSVQFPEEKELVRVYYNLGYDEKNNPHVNGIYMGSNIYIDPDDTDTIYLDFGGLWEMKRDKQNYSTSGKSLTGKG